MFKVVNLETGKIETVYGICGSMFLMYDTTYDSWFYDDISKHKPVEDQKWN